MELCVIKGNFKFGIRVPFLFQLHPMKQNYTLVSSFLFNCELLLVTSYAVVEFCAQSFSVYARDTSAQGILFRVYVFTTLHFAFLSFISLASYLFYFSFFSGLSSHVQVSLRWLFTICVV
jgi:hypothetical protein